MFLKFFTIFLSSDFDSDSNCGVFCGWYHMGQLILSSRVKSVFLHIALKVGYNSRKFGMTLSGRNYIMCSFLQLPVVRKLELSSVSVGQVESKDLSCSDGWNNAFVMVVNK